MRATLLRSFLPSVLALALTAGDAFAQRITTPRAASPAAEVSQSIGISKVTINYSRPAVKDREIWGTNLAHYGYTNLGFGSATAAPWRAGANENTVIIFSHDAQVEGKNIPAGTYGLHVGIHEDGKADIIFSNNSSSWGSYFYNQDEDQLRVSVNSTETEPTERLTFDFVDIDNTSAVAVLDWENKRFPFKVSFDVHEIVLTNAREELRSVTGFGWQGPASAAQYCLQNDINHEEAMRWADQAVANNKNFNTLFVKAGLTQKLGKDAGSVYDEAAKLASKGQMNFMAYQVMNAGDNERALRFFKTNVKNNPDDPNMHDSLGDYYKTTGNKKSAIKEYKKCLSMNPPPPVKAASINNLKELGVDTSAYEVGS